MLSVLGLDLGCTVKCTPLPFALQEFFWASPSGTPSGEGVYLSVYSITLVLIRIQYACLLVNPIKCIFPNVSLEYNGHIREAMPWRLL